MRILAVFFKYFLPILFSVVLLWLAFQKVSWQAIVEPFARANYFWIGVSGVLAFLSHLIRAARWQLAVEPLGYSMRLIPAFMAVMVGYFMNFVIPRAGEFARCGMIQRLAGVPADKAFGTVVVERVIDVLMLGVLCIVLLLVEFNGLSKFFLDFFQDKFGSLAGLWWLALIGLSLVVLAVGFGFFYWQKLTKLSFFPRLQSIFLNIWVGIMSIRKVKNLPLFILYTLLIWLMYYLMAYVLFFCFPETAHLDMWFGYLILIMGTIGMATPVQGGFGAYHLLVGSVFALRNLTAEQGVVLATFMHTIQMIFVLVIGGACLLISWFWQTKSDVKA
jgi:glycosyltransferase 2 family protein